MRGTMNLIEFLTSDGWLGFCWADILCSVVIVVIIDIAGFLIKRRSK